MNLQEGIKYIYSKSMKREELINPFFLYCLLSDVCKNSFDAKKELDIYWKVIRVINIYKTLLTEGIEDGLVILKKDYFKIKDNVDILDYKRCVIYTVNSIYPDYFKIKKINKQALNMLYGFEINNKELIKFKANRKEVVIPKDVKVIKPYAFNGQNKIEKIVIPSSVEIIHSYAFNNLPNLKKVELADVEIIDKYAFNNCDRVVITCINNFCKGELWNKNWNVINNKGILPKRSKVIYKSIK